MGVEGHQPAALFLFIYLFVFITFQEAVFRAPAWEKELLFLVSGDDNKKLTAEPNQPIMTQMKLHPRNKGDCCDEINWIQI